MRIVILAAVMLTSVESTARSSPRSFAVRACHLFNRVSDVQSSLSRHCRQLGYRQGQRVIDRRTEVDVVRANTQVRVSGSTSVTDPHVVGAWADRNTERTTRTRRSASRNIFAATIAQRINADGRTRHRIAQRILQHPTQGGYVVSDRTLPLLHRSTMT